MLLNLFLIIVGLALLIISADWLVRGASSLAIQFNVAPLLIGLTIIAFGTSAPELTVNLISAVNGSSDLALGNIIGSNIANILLVLGFVAFIKTIKVKNSTVWKEIPFALLGSIMLLVMANHVFLDGTDKNVITRTDGIMLIAMMGIFMFYVISSALNNKHTKEENDEGIKEYTKLLSIVLIIAGLIGLFVGGRVLVDNSVSLAVRAGLSEAFIGLTIVAIGTSLPELVTSVVAAMKGHTDLAIGNIIGSNIFNIFWVVGLTSVILPLPVGAEIQADILISIVATFLLFLFMFFGKKRSIGRPEGLIFVGLYIAYILFAILRG